MRWANVQSNDTADDQFLSFDIVNMTNGQVDGTWTDTDFQNVANLPPLTPRFVAVDQILFTENFR